MDDDARSTLQSIETTLRALVGLVAYRLQTEDEALPGPRKRTIDRLLYDAGLTQAEVGRILGKTPQAVSQVLKRER